MKFHLWGVLLLLLKIIPNTASAQNFNTSPITFTPSNLVEFKLNMPVTHLDIQNYTPSSRAVYAGQNITFRFYLRHNEWTDWNVFFGLRWDTDLDASNGVSWSNWELNQGQGYYATVNKTFPAPGKYTLTFELQLYNTLGQSYSRQKQYEIFVAPVPTNVYADQNNNKLYYWQGNDNVYNKPVIMLEGYDPLNDTSPEFNYALGSDLIELAKGQGYDVFIMDWANGGADLAVNRDVFLGACKFAHQKLNGLDAAVQAVGISMGGVIGRYGLAWAEDNSSLYHPNQYIDHYVNTFISFDSPQQGAHVNTNLQDFIKDYGNSSQLVTLQSAAAKQMLYNDVFDNTNTHNYFYNSTLKVLNDQRQTGGEYTNGYPRRCKNYGVSNGNRNANYPTKTTSDKLATLNIYVNINAGDIITFPAAHYTKNIYVQQRDIWPGSTFTYDLTRLSTEGFMGFFDGGFGPFAVQAGGAWKFDVLFNPGYTPTESSIDLDGYTRTNDGSLVGGTSWFDGTLTQTTFHRHEELTLESKNQVMAWLNNNRTNPYLARSSGETASAISHKRVIVNFTDESAFEDGYKIERSKENEPFAEIATIGPNANQYVDYCTEPNTIYNYRIRSYSGTKYAPYGNNITVTTPAAASIQSPVNLSANGQPSYIDLSWGPVTGATGYRLYRSTNGCPNFSLEVSTSSYRDISPPAGQTFSYQVSALNGTAEGPLSNNIMTSALHLASTSITPLSSNAQTKIVKTADNKIHMVYESNGGIFKTTSSDNGASWLNEISVSPLPSASVYYRNPTLLLHNDGASLSTIYERVEQTGENSIHDIIWDGGPAIYISNYPYTFCGNLTNIEQFYTSAAFKANPVAVMTKTTGNAPSMFSVLYARGGEAPGLSLLIGPPVYSAPLGCQYVGPQPLWLENIIPMNNPINPALAVRVKPYQTKGVNYPRYWLFIVWEEPGANGGIKCTYGTLDEQASLSPNNIVWNTSPFTIASNNSFWNCSHPSIALDGSGNITIAYEYQYPLAHKGYIKTQKRLASDTYAIAREEHTFASTCFGENYFPHSPSLTDYRYSSTKQNDVSLIWQTEDNILLAAQYRNGTWTDPYVISAGGKQACLLATYNNDDNRMIVYAGTQSPYYSINTNPLNPPTPPSTPQLISPADQSAEVPVPTYFTWYCVPGATSYSVQIDNNPDFSSPEFTMTGLASTGIQAPTLQPWTSYYWRVTSSNNNGSSPWSNGPNGWTFSTGQSTTGGCPYVYTWNGNKFVEDNNILPQSEYSSTDNDVTDYYKLRKRLAVSDDDYVLQIREFEQEESRLDRVRLLAVDHPIGTNIAVNQSGEIILYSTPMRMKQAMLKSKNVIDKLSKEDSLTVSGNPGELLSFQFQFPQGKSESILTTSGGAILGGTEPQQEEKKKSLGKVLADAATKNGELFAFRKNLSQVYVPIVIPENGQLSLQIDQRCLLDYVNLGIQLPDRFTVQEASLRAARHSTLGNVRIKLNQSDHQYATLSPGEIIELHFSKPPSLASGERSFILISEGRYMRTYDAPKIQAKQIPEQFALEQNYPNPFNPSTTVRYQIPSLAFVTLSIYNLLGQEIAKLVDAELPAGSYSTTWDGSNLPSGIYYVHMNATDPSGKQLFQKSNKITLIK